MGSTTPVARRDAADALALVVGAVASGVFAYVYIALGTRVYGAEAFAPTGIIWSTWAMAAAAFTAPVEQYVAKMLQGDEADALPQLWRRLRWVGGGVFVCCTVGAVVLRTQLFGGGGFGYPLMLGAVWVGALLVGYVRGTLGGQKRYQASAVLFAAENALRLTVGLVIVAMGWGVEAFSVMVPLGSVVALLWYRSPDGSRATSTNRVEVRAIVALMIASSIAQVVLTGGPVAAALVGAAPTEVTVIFAVLAMFRAPYVLLGGFTGRITVAMVGAYRTDPGRAGPRMGGALLGSAAVGTLLVVPIAALIGPTALQLLFGDLPAPLSIISMAGAATAVALLTFVGGTGLMVMDRTKELLALWTAALVVAIPLVLLAPTGTPGFRVVLGVLVAELVALVGMSVLLWRGPPTPPGP